MRNGHHGRRHGIIGLSRSLGTILCLFLISGADIARAFVFEFDPPPGVDASDPHFMDGLLDVTEAPYFADPTGGADATAAIQNALEDARDYQLACFFPSGTYLVSDMLNAMQSDRDHPCVFVGSRNGPRPVLLLSPTAVGYEDPEAPKPLLWIWTQPDGATHEDPNLGEQANISFNQIFRGIDIDVRAHAGAIGLRFAASQGSSLEEVSILADGAYAGVVNCPGQGGGTHQVEIDGGRYGIVLETVSRFPTIVASTFHNQTDAAIFQEQLYVRLVVVGSEFVKPDGVAIDIASGLGLTLIDSRVEFTSGSGIVYRHAFRPDAYFSECYVRGATSFIQSGSYMDGPTDPNAWSEITEYVLTNTNSRTLVDGDLDADTPPVWTEGVVPASAEELRARHGWNGETFPGFEDPTVVNAKDLGAVGDGVADDTAALEAAIALHDRIFLPKGNYRITRTLELGPDTSFFGVAPMYSVLYGDPLSGSSGSPLITTVDDPFASTTLAFVSITYPSDGTQYTNLVWRAGRRSIVRDVHASVEVWPNEPIAEDHQVFIVRGNGGGRWFASSIWNGRFANLSYHPNFRHYWIDGTREPLWFYAMNFERSSTSPQSEIDGAENVRVYSLKAEAGTPGPEQLNTPLRIANSRNVEIYDVIGNIELRSGESIVLVEDAEDARVVHVSSFESDSTWSTITERYDGVETSIAGSERLSYFRRGVPSLSGLPGDAGSADTVPGDEPQEDGAESGSTDGSAGTPSSRTSELRLLQNPAHDQLRFEITLLRDDDVQVVVLDVAGRAVRTLEFGRLPIGTHKLTWDGHDDRGNPASAGVYFLGLRGPGGHGDQLDPMKRTRFRRATLLR
ncbi:MAG: hypothetical protein H6682_23175 [Candidatus Eisenbacteria bacterium]|nr:hypothetical protein [Candidatus Eisenbacteria bacterium]